ncbi:hypothetical protein GGS21DRAFT_533939 [Xylaria nigripes]|nr:hypothetical protein GGS21DRAFT_533939 [Xylaria nigripes]
MVTFNALSHFLCHPARAALDLLVTKIFGGGIGNPVDKSSNEIKSPVPRRRVVWSTCRIDLRRPPIHCLFDPYQ